MNVLMILTNNPFTNDPRVYDEARSLIKAGHKVTILARDKYNVNPLNEIINEISVRRVYNTNFMSMLPYNFFDLYFWWNEAYKKALKLYNEIKFEAVHCHDFSSLPIGVKLKKKLGIPLIYDAHEIWGFMVSSSISWWRYYLWKEKRLIPYVDGFIVAEDKYADYYKSITKKRLIPILNCKPLISTEYKPINNDIFTIIYIGTLSSKRFLLELTEVVEELKDVKCIIGGYVGLNQYIEKLKQNCDEANNLEFIGPVQPKDILPKTQKSDLVVCMIDPSVFNNRIATANKQFEAMVCGKPIICTKGTRSGKITEQEQCGLVIDFNKEALREAIIKLRDSPELCKKLGKNALKAAINKYNWELEEKKLVKIYEKI